jgi:hypothetical protein
MSGWGQSETPNHVSDGGSFRRKRPWRLAGPPMTLGNMRANGVRSLDVSCERGPVARSRAGAEAVPPPFQILSLIGNVITELPAGPAVVPPIKYEPLPTFVPQHQSNAPETLQQGEPADAGELRVVAQHERQAVKGDSATQMVDVVNAEVSGEPAQGARQRPVIK